MWKEHDLIMLPTDERQPQINMIATTNKNELQLVGKDLVDMYEMHKMFGDFAPVNPYQHFYILSDEEIKEGDWFIGSNNIIRQCTDTTNDTIRYVESNQRCFNYKVHCKKVIATTDNYLERPIGKVFKIEGHYGFKTLRPFEVPQSFITHYISEYNKGNVITKVMVEYVNSSNEEWDEDTQSFWSKGFDLKINSDNTINIKSVKDSWSREEVEALLFKFMNRPIIIHDLGILMPLNEWIEQNL